MEAVLWGTGLLLGFALLWLLDKYRGRSPEAGRKVLSEVEKRTIAALIFAGLAAVGTALLPAFGIEVDLKQVVVCWILVGFAYGLTEIIVARLPG
nr:hypothetical protein [uncultured archaeon]UVT38862.1 hypothetical protein [uncultured bacterium]